MSTELPSHFPPEVLEQRAAKQRRRLHNTVGKLRSSITDLKLSVEESVRERLDPNRVARQHLRPLASAASFFGLILGYGVAGIFSRR
jgi:hypothetical protein